MNNHNKKDPQDQNTDGNNAIPDNELNQLNTNVEPAKSNSFRMQELSNLGQEKSAAQILKELLTHITAQSPQEAANLADDSKISEKDLVVITVDYVLEIAQKNRWELARYQNTYYMYTGTYWTKVGEDELKNFLGKSAEKINIDRFLARHFTFRNNLHSQFHDAGLFTPPTSDAKETKINLANGTFVITKEKQFLKPWDSNDFMLYKLNFEYDAEASAPTFQQYLDRVLPDKSKQLVLAEYLGYVFIKNSVLKLEKALILFGDGKNGKSVLFDIILKVLGSENVSNFSLQSLTDEKGYHRALLTGKLLNYCSELSTKLNPTMFKMLVSGEPLDARQIYQKAFLLTEIPRLMFNTNVLPKDIEVNTGFFRRFIIIHFDQIISNEEKDVNLANKIIENELSGVFNWVLEGLKRILKQNDFSMSAAIENALRDFKLNSDSVNLFLEDGNFIPGKSNQTQLKHFYASFREYCKESGYTACSAKTFSQRLRNYNYVIERRSPGRVIFFDKVFQQ